MERYGGFSAAGHSLYDHISIGDVTDDPVLLLLDRGDNISQHCLFIL